MRARAFIRLIVCTLVLAARVRAGGFRGNDQSARSVAMGGAVVATVNDPTAAEINPAIMCTLEGTNLSIGTAVTIPEYSFSGPGPAAPTTKMTSQVLFPPNLFLSHTFGNGLAVGVSATIPYSYKTEWDPGWMGGRAATNSEMRIAVFAPAVSYRVLDDLSLGIALTIAMSRVSLTRRIGFEQYGLPRDPDGSESVEGNGRIGYGIQLGLLYRPFDALTLGAAYRSRTTVDIDNANATFSGIPDTLGSTFVNGNARTSFVTPDNLQVGVGWTPGEGIQVEADAEYVFWSAIKAIRTNFPSSPAANTTFEENWRDTFSAHFGLEIAFSDVVLRLGTLYERTPIPAEYVRPSLPDADRIGYGGGIGYNVGEGLQVDFSYMFVHFNNREITNSRVAYAVDEYLNGTYNLSANIVGISAKYTWN